MGADTDGEDSSFLGKVKAGLLLVALWPVVAIAKVVEFIEAVSAVVVVSVWRAVVWPFAKVVELARK